MSLLSELEYVVSRVMEINTSVSCVHLQLRQEHGVVQGVGFLSNCDYFGVRSTEGYIWTAHNRFRPIRRLWGGRIPSAARLEVVHNGEISRMARTAASWSAGLPLHD